MKKLYREEELWEQESLKLKAETSERGEQFKRELKQHHINLEDEKRKKIEQEDKLIETLNVLTKDNERLQQEREKEKLNNSKSYQVKNLNFKILGFEELYIFLGAQI